MLSGDTKVGLWSLMIPHAPLRRVFFVTISSALLGGLLFYFEHSMFVVGAFVGGSIGAALTSLETFVLRRNAGAFFRQLPFLPYLALRVLLYAGVVLLVSAVMNWLSTPDGLVINMSRADIVATIAISVCTILLFGINDLLGPGVLFAFVAGRYYHPRLDHRKSDRTQGRRRVDPNRRRSQRPRPGDPRSPLTRLRGYLTGQTDGSTDCATLRRRERTRALGFAPLENEMWLQPRRRCRRSGEMWSHGPTGAAADGKMWSHFVFLVYGRIPAGCRLGEHAWSLSAFKEAKAHTSWSSSELRRMAS